VSGIANDLQGKDAPILRLIDTGKLKEATTATIAALDKAYADVSKAIKSNQEKNAEDLNK